MPLYKMTLAYDGTAYRGWQLQPQGDTVQGRLESALSRMAKAPVRVTAAGRTDSGVHAWAQVSHFELARPIPAVGILRGANAMLPTDIRVLAVEEAEPGFHARFSARSKTYRYYLERASVASPFRARFALHYPHPLDRPSLDEAARGFEGERDFSSFRAASCEARTAVRRCTVSRFFEENGELVYEIAANGFLQHMVRNIVGTLLEVGGGKRTPSSIEALFTAGERGGAGATAPAKGLHLVKVDY